MKLILRECREIPETEVEIRYRERDSEVDNLINVINASGDVLSGINAKGDTVKIYLSQILYIEAVDRGVYAYVAKDYYKIRKTLYELEDDLKEKFFVRISKSTIANLKAVKAVAPEDSRKVKLLMRNGEYLMVSRNYVNDFKSAIGIKGGKKDE